MNKERLIKLLLGILGTDVDLGFLRRLEENEIETLIACVRERVDQAGH